MFQVTLFWSGKSFLSSLIGPQMLSLLQVQKTWRGFYTRKYIFNYHSRKKYLEGLKIKNEIVRNELEEFAEQQEQMAQWKQEADEKKQLDEYARKNHHLLSTEVLPGIYNSPFQPWVPAIPGFKVTIIFLFNQLMHIGQFVLFFFV